MRILLRKNKEINKLEDISGVFSRKVLFATNTIEYPKENFAFQIFNLRKVGLKESKVDFEFFSLEKLFTSMASVYVDVKKFNFNREENSDSSGLSKLSFSSRKESTNGYYYIDNNDFSFREYFINSDMSDSQFVKKGNIEYRTVSYSLNTFFDKSKSISKYSISNAKLVTVVQIKMPDGNLVEYECEYIYIARNPFNSIKVNSNVSAKKDMFELKSNYNESLFNSNKNLKLTDEMSNFIEKAIKAPKLYDVNK